MTTAPLDPTFDNGLWWSSPGSRIMGVGEVVDVIREAAATSTVGHRGGQ